MFYDAFAALIGQAGDAVTARPSGDSEDPRFQREGRQIATFLRRTAAVWPEIFATLAAETEALERGLTQTNTALTKNGLAPIGVEEASLPVGPLERYRVINLCLDRSIEQLAAASNASWVESALRDVRASLAEASEIQGRLVDRMLEVR